MTDTAPCSSSFCLWTCRTRLNTDGLKGAGDTHQTELTEFKPVKYFILLEKRGAFVGVTGYLLTTLATVLSLTAAPSSSDKDGSGKKHMDF